MLIFIGLARFELTPNGPKPHVLPGYTIIRIMGYVLVHYPFMNPWITPVLCCILHKPVFISFAPLSQ